MSGRLGQACDRWIYTACLCFGLDLADQQASGFRYAYSVYQAEYSRNLIFASGARMDRVSAPSPTGPVPGWTCRPCGPCSGSRSGGADGRAVAEASSGDRETCV